MAGGNIDQSIREAIIAILKKHGAQRIAIFGSYARGEAKAESDIDLLTEKSISLHLAGPIHHDEVVIVG